MKRIFAFCLLLAAAAVLFCAALFLNGQRYYLLACLILLLAFAALLGRLERRRLRAREMVLLAVMTSLAVMGRAVFFLLPQFKPAAALVILAGALLGAESGFLVGAMTGFVSNFFFGQGPWTPFQMFGFGLIGFFAGLVFTKLPVLLYGLRGAVRLFDIRAVRKRRDAFYNRAGGRGDASGICRRTGKRRVV